MNTAQALIAHLDQHTLADNDNIRLTLASALVGYPVLLEGLPGVGKTGLALGVAQALALDLKRLQCTPDIQPADITGYLRPDAGGREFVFVPGPVFTPCLLVDEINRANPRSQSALLEAMAEGTVTVEGQTHTLPSERVILATQNPQDQVGTQALPESQLDRFGVVLELGYPSSEKEQAVMARSLHQPPAPPAVSLMQARSEALSSEIKPAALDYLTRLVEATRTDDRFHHGLSTRGALVLADMSRGLAHIEGRGYVTPENIQGAFCAVARHRLVQNNQTPGRLTPDSVLQSLLDRVPL